MSILIWTMLWFWDVNWVELSWCFAVRAVFLLLGLVFQWRISFVILCKVANRGKWFMAAKKLSQFQLMLQSNVKLKSKKAFIVRQANIFLVFILYLKMWCIWKKLCFFFPICDFYSGLMKSFSLIKKNLNTIDIRVWILTLLVSYP